MLRDYNERRAKAVIFGSADGELDFLDRCMAGIRPYERDILEKTLIEKVSVRQFARDSGFSRDAITKQRLESLKMIAKFFNIFYSPKE